MSVAKLSGFWTILILILFSTHQALGTECETCHTLEAGSYLHSPYSRHQCADCHGRENSPSNQGLDLSEVRWFARGNLEKGTSFLLIPRSRQNKALIFQAEELGKNVLLDPHQSAPFPLSSKPLEITDIKTCGIENGIWWEAKICLSINQPAEAEISCENLYEYHDHWSSFHKIVLAGLREEKNYQCLVKVRNIEGQEVEETFSFKIRPQKEISLPRAHKIEAKLYQLQTGEIILYIETDGSLSWRLGELPYQLSNNNSNSHHPFLYSPLKASLDVCYRCHPDQKTGVTHPVKVPLKKGMKKTDLPLENGLVTCVSCHEPHVGNLPYLLRKENTALCLSCHDDRYYK